MHGGGASSVPRLGVDVDVDLDADALVADRGQAVQAAVQVGGEVCLVEELVDVDLARLSREGDEDRSHVPRVGSLRGVMDVEDLGRAGTGCAG